MHWTKPFLAVAAVYLLLVGNASATELKKPELMENVAPVPSALLMNSYRYMGKLKHFSIDAVTTSDDTWLNEMVVTYTHHIHIDLKRPGQLRVITSGDLKEKEYYINNGHFTVYDALTNYYGELEVPKSIDKALDFLFEKYDVKSPLANMLYRDLDRRIPPRNKGYYFGMSDVDGVACHHIGFVSATQEYQVWIEADEKPLIWKFVIIDKTEPEMLRSGTRLRWNLNEKLDDRIFYFHPPQGAIEIDIEPAGEGA